jgi:putative transposase
MDPGKPIWRTRFYDFNIYCFEKASEKLEYIHNNPVRKGLAANAHEWSYGSARWYLLQRLVGIKIVPLS